MMEIQSWGSFDGIGIKMPSRFYVLDDSEQLPFHVPTWTDLGRM
jgi:hypothetical protein